MTGPLAAVEFEETDADREFVPVPGCCEDCDAYLADLKAIGNWLRPRRVRANYRRRLRNRRRR